DMKPANFSIGLSPDNNILYMLDFGSARKYREEDGRLRHIMMHKTEKSSHLCYVTPYFSSINRAGKGWMDYVYDESVKTAPGTLLYCSVCCHENQEKSRRDDLETWLYMMLEFFWTGIITWWNFGKDKAKLVEHKSIILQKPRELHARMSNKISFFSHS
ncbi:hypothetical protein PENTCL1PPCAC_13157, partial [Pristionchus entomophagus]